MGTGELRVTYRSIPSLTVALSASGNRRRVRYMRNRPQTSSSRNTPLLAQRENESTVHRFAVTSTFRTLLARAGRIGLKVGGALAAAGVVYDIANGKDVDQAIVSGAAGFGASVLAGAGAGALIGSAIPIPGVGTIGGALVGATVGIFTSGAVDSLYQNGIGSPGDAITDGATAVADTGKAIGGFAKGAWDAIF